MADGEDDNVINLVARKRDREAARQSEFPAGDKISDYWPDIDSVVANMRENGVSTERIARFFKIVAIEELNEVGWSKSQIGHFMKYPVVDRDN